jgi:DNA gyrase subunit A
MELGVVRQVDIDREMQAAYLSYAMSVIVARALPDARDGLKPVHRRILYAMHDMGLRPESAYKKSARIVGEVLGKYHPHGDAAVYETMARMAQDFSMRYLLVDGQGNFGSVDGDAPAAMRYTEARLARMAEELLQDIEKETVSWGDNFDGTLQEPQVLPARLPNLLLNGSSGIAVGMATSIPPHHLGEVCDALGYMLDNWTKLDDVTVEELMDFIPGPDFPTGGVIYRRADDGSDAISHAYATGRGRITVQARAHVEEMTRGKNRIVVTELPYQVNKTALAERIADLARDGKLEGITDLRDESDRRGMRLVVELSRNAVPEQVMNDLYRHTPLRSTFSVILLALVEGEPRLLSLKKALQLYLEHRLEVVRRRSEFELARARERAHILEGLLTALKHLDEVINTIRRSPDSDTARGRLMKRFKLSQVQATAILDMPLRRLAALERQKIEDEYKEKQRLIKELTELLASPKKMRAAVKTELAEIKAQYSDARRTQIVDRQPGAFTAGELLPDEPVWITIRQSGHVVRSAGREAPDLGRVLQDAPVACLSANTRETLFLFTASGQAAAVGIHRVPEGAGAHWADFTPLGKREQVIAALVLKADIAGTLFLATHKGMVKRVAVGELPGAGSPAFSPIKLDTGDALGWTALTPGDAEIILVTAAGQAIRFKEDEVRPMGLPAGGVMGVKLGANDHLVGMDVVRPRADLMTVALNGYAKRTPLGEYPTQGRNGSGVIAAKLTKGTTLVGASVVNADDKIVLTTADGGGRLLRALNAARMGRTTQGEMIVALKPKERLAGVVRVEGSATAPELNGGNGATPDISRGPTAKTPVGKSPSNGRSKATRAPRSAAATKRPASAKHTTGKATAKPETTKARKSATPSRRSKPAATKAAPKTATATGKSKPAAAKTRTTSTKAKITTMRVRSTATKPKPEATKTKAPARAKAAMAKTKPAAKAKPMASKAASATSRPKPKAPASKAKTPQGKAARPTTRTKPVAKAKAEPAKNPSRARSSR